MGHGFHSYVSLPEGTTSKLLNVLRYSRFVAFEDDSYHHQRFLALDHQASERLPWIPWRPHVTRMACEMGEKKKPLTNRAT
jgi:DNA-binding IclR family transcriptional regulator